MIFQKWQKLFERIALLQKLDNQGQEFYILKQFSEQLSQNQGSQVVEKLLHTLCQYYQQIFQRILRFFPNNINVYFILYDWINALDKKASKQHLVQMLQILQNSLSMHREKTVKYFEIYGKISIKATTVLLEDQKYQKALLLITSFNQDFRNFFQSSIFAKNQIKNNSLLMKQFVKSFLLIALSHIQIDQFKNHEIIVKIIQKCNCIIENMLRRNIIQQNDELIQFFNQIYKLVQKQKGVQKCIEKTNLVKSFETISPKYTDFAQNKILKNSNNSVKLSQIGSTIKSQEMDSKNFIKKDSKIKDFQITQNFQRTLARNKQQFQKQKNESINGRILQQILVELENAKIDRQKIMQDQKLILQTIQPFLNQQPTIQQQKKVEDIDIQLYLVKPKLQDLILLQCISNQLSLDQNTLTYTIPLKTHIKKQQVSFQLRHKSQKKIFMSIRMQEDNKMSNSFNLNLKQLNVVLRYCNINFVSSIDEPISQIDTFIELITKFLVYYLKIEREIIRNNQKKFSTSLNIFPCFPCQIIVEDYILNDSKLIETLLSSNIYKMTYLDPINHNIQMQTFLIDNYDNFLNKDYHSLDDANIIDENQLHQSCGKFINIKHLSLYQEKKIEYIKQYYETYLKSKIDKITEFLKIKRKFQNIVTLFLRNSKKKFEIFIFREIQKKDQLLIYESHFQKDKHFDEKYSVNKLCLSLVESLFKINFDQIYKIDKQFFYYLIYSCSQYERNQEFITNETLEQLITCYEGQLLFKQHSNVNYFIIDGPNFVLLPVTLCIYKFQLEQKIYLYAKKLTQQQKSQYLRNLSNKEFLQKVFSILYFQYEQEIYPKDPFIFNCQKVRFIPLERFTKFMQQF